MTKIDLRPSGVALHFIKHKANSGEINGLQRHNERTPGGRHGNDKIDDARTKDNIFLIRDERQLNKRIEDTITQNRDGGMKGVRKNAVRMVEGTVQLSGKVLDEPEEKQIELLKDSFEYLQDTFGKDNFVSAVIHLDETHPHLHFDFVPIENGRLTAKTIISPNRLKKYQGDFLKHLQDDYSYLNFQRGTGEHNGLSQGTFERLMAEQARVEKELDDRENALDKREDALDEREDKLGNREADVKEKRRELIMSGIELSGKKEALKNKEVELNRRSEEIQHKEEDVSNREVTVNQAAVRIAENGRKLNEFKIRLAKKDKELKEKEEALRGRESSLEAREADLDKKDREADRKLSEAARMAQEADKKDKEADNKLADAEAKDRDADQKLSRYAELMRQFEQAKKAFEEWRQNKLQEIVDKRNEVQQEITNRWNNLRRAWSRTVNKVKHGALRPEPVEKLVDKYDPLTYDKVDEFADGLNDLSNSVDNNNQMHM